MYYVMRASAPSLHRESFDSRKPAVFSPCAHARMISGWDEGRENTFQKEENTLRKLFRRAGEAKGLSIILKTNETPFPLRNGRSA